MTDHDKRKATSVVGLWAVITVCAASFGSPGWAKAPVPLSAASEHPRAATRLSAEDEVVAKIGASVIKRTEFTHWLRIVHAEGEKPGRHRCRIRHLADAELEDDRRAALDFTAFTRWVYGEAHERGVTVSEDTVRSERDKTKRLAFDSEKAYRLFLKRTCQTEKDIGRRVRLDLLGTRIRQQVLTGVTGTPERTRLLREFEARFTEKWRARTLCGAGYEASSCSSSDATP